MGAMKFANIMLHSKTSWSVWSACERTRKHGLREGIPAGQGTLSKYLPHPPIFHPLPRNYSQFTITY